MKNLISLAFLAFFLIDPSSAEAQIAESIQNLKGRWYQETRNSITYSIWNDLGPESLGNRTFSIVCGDTVLQSEALLQYHDTSATLLISTAGSVQHYSLVHTDNAQMLWENVDLKGSPQKLEWKFSSGGYFTVLQDGLETAYRKDSKEPFKLKLRVGAGINLNQYANPVGANRFLANNRVALAQGETTPLPGGEIAFSAGVLFPSTPVCLNVEFGMAYRQVGVTASFYNPQSAGLIDRNGRYQNYNYYFGLVPEVYIGKQRKLSVSAGFYADLLQQRFYKGVNTVVSNDPSKSGDTLPGNDIDFEKGIMLGLHYRLKLQDRLRPQMYIRYTHGLSVTQVRAISMGLAVEFEKR